MDVLTDFLKESGVRKEKRRLRAKEFIRLKREQLQRPLKTSLGYGAGGAVTAPILSALYRKIEGLPKSGRHYTLGKVKIPTWIPAAAAAGFIGGGVLPYFHQMFEYKRKVKLQKRMKELKPSLGKQSSIMRIFTKPQLRSGKPVWISKQNLKPLLAKLNKRRSVGRHEIGLPEG